MKPFKFSKKNREYIKWDKTHTEVRITPKAPPAPEGEPLRIEADDDTAQGIYANMAIVTNTETEFLFDFIFSHPGPGAARVLARVISSPVHARRLCAALRENIKKYEARFGPVKD